MARDVERGRLAAEDCDEALALMSWSTEYEVFDNSDIVIEAATEDEEIKKAVALDHEGKYAEAISAYDTFLNLQSDTFSNLQSGTSKKRGGTRQDSIFSSWH